MGIHLFWDRKTASDQLSNQIVKQIPDYRQRREKTQGWAWYGFEREHVMWHRWGLGPGGPFQSGVSLFLWSARSLYKNNVLLSRSHPSGIWYLMPQIKKMFALEIILSKELGLLPCFSSEKVSWKTSLIKIYLGQSKRRTPMSAVWCLFSKLLPSSSC